MILFCLYADDLPFSHILKKQISHLVVTVTDEAQTTTLEALATDVYGRIFTFFTSVTHLEFGVYHTPRHLPLLLRDLPSNICFSSNIVHLCAKVLYFDDCLRFLDGRLYQMNTFIVTVD
ncbi:unnamed protein product [Rotaria sp. Silwood2]|nr:unnamed protein product [Rotaria sp. Silwood2]CAF3256626.1 unnamed protein product [Rotaria sp. Silwood2]CAF4059927.1 unnamed protein product [Rotaria sp. Silwood2]CAF4086877.1 unnamed protein product [Rotaria sp. Silwood2]CAF4364024.1 unnamed protein product [Rotaria sp. Silwood2]